MQKNQWVQVVRYGIEVAIRPRQFHLDFRIKDRGLPGMHCQRDCESLHDPI